jgi:hypothetical protein
MLRFLPGNRTAEDHFVKARKRRRQIFIAVTGPQYTALGSTHHATFVACQSKFASSALKRPLGGRIERIKSNLLLSSDPLGEPEELSETEPERVAGA